MDGEKQTPLHRAIRENETEEGNRKSVIKELLQNGGDVNLKDCHNATPLHYATSEPEDLFQDLLNQFTDPNIKGFEDGETLLHIATTSESESNVKTLMRYGADPNIRDYNLISCLENALIFEHKGVFKVMIYNN